jgi:Domain of unknown function (DUF4893)
MRKNLLALLPLLLLAFPAQADGVLDKLLTPEDKTRLENFEKTRAEALQQGLRGEAPDVDVLTKAREGEKLGLASGYDPTGNWKCRTIKVGGEFLDLTVYGWFKCRITEDNLGWKVEKVSGSQRFTGYLYTRSDTELIFVGAGHVNDDPPRKYGDDSKENQVAIVSRLGKQKLVFEFPAPYYESKLDIILMER